MRGAPATTLEARLLWALVDADIWFLTLVGLTVARYGFDVSALTATTWLFTLAMTALHLVIGFASGPYAPGRPRSPVGEVLDLTRTVGAVGLLGFCIEVLSAGLWAPRSVPLVSAGCALIVMCGLRFVARAVAPHGHDGGPPEEGGDEAPEEVQLDQHRR